MSDHRAPRGDRLRRIARTGVAVTGGVLALSGIAAGTASAAEMPSLPGTPMGGAGLAPTGLTPTTPVDGFTYHWMTYHYGEENFAADEVGRITSDPQRYVGIHLDMAKMMLGQETPSAGSTGPAGYGSSGY